MSERYVARQALTREQIGKLTHSALASHPDLSPEEKQLARVTAKAAWDKRPMRRRPDESAGEFSKRKRESAPTDKREYSRLQRKTFEKALFDSESQRLKRLMDTQTASITRESAEASAALVDDLEKQERRESFGTGLGFPEGND